MLILSVDSLAGTRAVAAAVADAARTGDVVILSGEMGAGKTAFAQAFGAAIGVEEPMTSPTFTLVCSYPVTSRLTLHHADLYRLDRTGEVDDLALAELADLGGIVLIEWGEIVEGSFDDYLHIHLEPNGDDVDEWGSPLGRVIEVSGAGRTWAARWDRLARTLAEWS